MRVLLDLNVLIDVAARWEIFPDSLSLYNEVVGNGKHQGSWAGCGYTTLYYILTKLLTESEARAVVNRFEEVLVLLPFAPSTAAKARRIAMKDLEDACVAATAMEGDCDVIATRNTEDYRNSPVPARAPAGILKALRRR